jgi:hypothetical protein
MVPGNYRLPIWRNFSALVRVSSLLHRVYGAQQAQLIQVLRRSSLDVRLWPVIAR